MAEAFYQGIGALRSGDSGVLARTTRHGSNRPEMPITPQKGQRDISLHQGLQRSRCLNCCSDCYRVGRTSSRAGYSRCGPPPFTAHPVLQLHSHWTADVIHLFSQDVASTGATQKEVPPERARVPSSSAPLLALAYFQSLPIAKLRKAPAPVLKLPKFRSGSIMLPLQVRIRQFCHCIRILKLLIWRSITRLAQNHSSIHPLDQVFLCRCQRAIFFQTHRFEGTSEHFLPLLTC
jgi:hypothetical protein